MDQSIVHILRIFNNKCTCNQCQDENNSYDDDTSEGIEVTTDPQAFYKAKKKKSKSANKQLR